MHQKLNAIIVNKELLSPEVNQQIPRNPMRALRENYAKRIEIKDAHLSRFIELKDLIYLEANGSYTKAKTSTGEFLASRNLRHFQNILLSNPMFCRIHHKTLLNLNHVDYFDHKRNLAFLKSKEALAVSVRKKEAFLEAIRAL